MDFFEVTTPALSYVLINSAAVLHFSHSGPVRADDLKGIHSKRWLRRHALVHPVTSTTTPRVGFRWRRYPSFSLSCPATTAPGLSPLTSSLGGRFSPWRDFSRVETAVPEFALRSSGRIRHQPRRQGFRPFVHAETTYLHHIADAFLARL